jgi:hypothetical protein
VALLCSSAMAPSAAAEPAAAAATPTPAVAALAAGAPPSPFELHVLAAPSLCEASAILATPSDEGLVLVADNEVDDQLYRFAIAGNGLGAGTVLAMPGPKDARPDDIEALARLGNEIVVVGSQSRNKECVVRPKRQRIRRLVSADGGALKETGAVVDANKTWRDALQNEGAKCLSTLFTASTPAGADRFCKALVAAEKLAALDGKHCQEVANVEGAFGTTDGRLWLGLRAPLVDGNAVLLRLAGGASELRFDRVTLLRLDGRGIRELAVAGEQLYGIAGPMLDCAEPFALFRLSAAAAVGGGEPQVEILRADLVTSSEGLLVRGKRAYVVVDGDEPAEGDTTGTCRSPAQWYTFDLPDA